MPAPKRKKSSGPSRRLSWRGRVALALTVIALVAASYWLHVQPWETQQAVAWVLGKEAVRTSNRVGDSLDSLLSLIQGGGFSTKVEGLAVDENAYVLAGLPSPSSAYPNRIRVLYNRAYVVGYDDTRRCPAWVAYKLVHGRFAAGERPSGFQTDPRTSAAVHPDAYSGSGYDRGHLAPNFGIARSYGREAQLETFLMSNIVPQSHRLNAGPWKKLEEKDADSFASRLGEVWVAFTEDKLFQDCLWAWWAEVNDLLRLPQVPWSKCPTLGPDWSESILSLHRK